MESGKLTKPLCVEGDKVRDRLIRIFFGSSSDLLRIFFGSSSVFFGSLSVHIFIVCSRFYILKLS